MARFSLALLSLCVAACTLAAPMQRRQTGDLQCNLARLQIIADVASAETLLGQINATDLATASAVAVAQTGLKSVDTAIQTILAAVLQGNTAPPETRDQVGNGLTAAQTALKSITDPSVNASVAAVQAKIASAGVDGNNVVAECK
ncbi:hypothetical protein GGX14DRAFT_579561 [Mycena pura]|uniref:Cell wall protein n=1 Tax=Mycena pura TaxID=153505 RepID=A0AAD6Y459_9AGAR|nr:hypothetical protein GGX14DRAFT_579561 [Mycena pura]